MKRSSSIFAPALTFAALCVVPPGVAHAQPTCAQVPPAAMGGLLQRIPIPQFEAGPLGNEAIGQFLSVACANDSLKGHLLSTCARTGHALSVRDLSRLILEDVVELPRRSLNRSSLSGVNPQALNAGVALLEVLLRGGDLRGVAYRLVRAYPQELAGLMACPEPTMPTATVTAGPIDPLSIAGILILRILADGPRSERPDGYYASLVAGVVSQLAPAGSVPAVQVADVRALVEGARSAQAVFDRMSQTGAYDAEAVAPMARAVSAAVSIATGQSVEVPQDAVDAGVALAEGDVERAAIAIAGLTGLASSVPPSAARYWVVAAKVLRARSEGELERILRSAVLGVPWLEPVVFDVNAGWPSLSRSDFRIVGDVTLGYMGRSWGVVARGHLQSYDLASGTARYEVDAYGGSAEGWYAGSRGAWRFEARASVGGAYYDTQTIDTAATNLFADSTTWTYRSLLVLGVRYQMTSDAWVGLWAGGGGQYETIDSVTVPNGANPTVGINDQDKLGAIGQARLRFLWNFWPGYATARLRGDTQYFDIRQITATTTTAGGVATLSSLVTQHQFELSARAHLDGDFGRFFGFVPSVQGGVDVVQRWGTGGTSSALVPVVGAGIRRDSF